MSNNNEISHDPLETPYTIILVLQLQQTTILTFRLS